jgi:hypothetical protein
MVNFNDHPTARASVWEHETEDGEQVAISKGGVDGGIPLFWASLVSDATVVAPPEAAVQAVRTGRWRRL